MSEMERNKGTLTLVATSCEEYCADEGIDFSSYGTAYAYMVEELYEDYIIIADKVYRVEWEVKSDTDCYGFVEVDVLDTGEIKFHTLHYNGGGSLSEVIEQELNKTKGE